MLQIRGWIALCGLVLGAPALAAGWEYGSEPDKLTGKATAYAALQSDDQLALDFPYRGRNYGQITVRQSPRHGLDVYFQIEKGQLICGYGEDACSVVVVVDGKKPQRFAMTKPSDGTSNTLFFSNAKRFIDAARQAKEIRIAATVYHAGEPTLTFSTPTPLAWPPKK